MGEVEQSGSAAGSGSKTGDGEMSAVERRRAERRRKILMNQDERFKKILGPNAELPRSSTRPSAFTDDFEEPVLPEEHLTREFLENASKQRHGTDTNNPGPAQYEVTPAQISRHRLYLCLLGAALPICGLNYCFLYFALWELAVLTVSKQIPFPSSKPNIIFTLIMLMGMKEQDSQRLKLIIRLFKWLGTDFSLFFVSVILSQFMWQVVSPVLYNLLMSF